MSESFTTSLLMDLASWSVDLVGSESLRESDSVSRDTEERWFVMIVSVLSATCSYYGALCELNGCIYSIRSGPLGTNSQDSKW